MCSNETPEHHRVLVVGAGIHGLVIAKTYLEIDQNVDIMLIDCEPSVGGVWSADRIYPGLCFETPTPFLDFSDMSMAEEFGMENWADIPGECVNEHVVRFATRFDLIRRCRFNTMVQKVERDNSKWKIMVQPIASGCPWVANNEAPFKALTCDKLILATGITSQPMIPDIDLSSFNGFKFHSIEMGRRYTELTADSVKHVTIVGGHKSALEAVGTAAQAGKKVEWIMRTKGGGPTWLFPSKMSKGVPLTRIPTLRGISLIGMSVYNSGGRLSKFLHSGQWWLGAWLSSCLWNYMTRIVKGDKYSKSETGHKLEPVAESVFWFVPGATICHERDLETLRIVDEERLITINRAEIASAHGRMVTFDNGTTIETDGIVFCTTWALSNHTTIAPDLANDLGLPVLKTQLPAAEKEYWERLDDRAGDDILNSYKALNSPPKNATPNSFNISPFRLFRQIIPPKLAACGDNSIVIIGNYANLQVQLTAEVTSLFAVAYLEDILPPATKILLQNPEAMNEDIAHVDAYRRKRYMGFQPYRLAIFEWLEFIDQLMNDLGLRADRKRLQTPRGWRGWFGLKAWYREWFEGYFGNDYKGIVQEFLQNVEQRRATTNDNTDATSVKGSKKHM